jgi:thiol-disulfide isomerase/thioredoxin/Flp pilus assembly protein TadD
MRIVATASGSLFIAFLLACTPLCTAQQPSEAITPQVAKLLAQARDFEKREQLTSAVDSYRAANKAGGGSCRECLQSLFALQMRMPLYRDAAATAARLEETAPDAAAKAIAGLGEARALFYANDEKPKRSLLDQANLVLIRAQAVAPDNSEIPMLRGRVLAMLGQNEEASRQFALCAKLLGPGNPLAARAQHFAENPILGRKQLAPDFTVTTQDGKQFSLGQAVGKIVMIDFWATWCGPCQHELPYIQGMADSFQDRSDFMMLSVSWDKNAAEWEHYIKKNEMAWPQYRDTDETMTQSFGISAVPTYILIDRDGIVRRKAVGGMLDIRSDLKDLLANKPIPDDSPADKTN